MSGFCRSLRWLWSVVLAFFLCLVCPAVWGQGYVVPAVTFSGDSSFSASELLAASGVTAGSSLDQAGMQAAAARLSATGMFSTIKFSFDGKTLHYEMAPAENLLAVRYTNFPWWKADEIAAQLKTAVPLFHGRAAAGSGTEQKISAALVAMLAARQVAATISATPDIDQATGKARSLDFHVTDPLIQIGAVTFTGASPEFSDRLGEIGKAATKVDYFTYETPGTLTQAVQSVYYDRGYLEVEVPSVAASAPLIDTAGGATVVRVPVTVAIDEGLQYKLGQFTVAGSVLMSQADYQSKALLKPGDIVEQEKLKRSLQMLSAPYVTRGYLRAKISATATFHRDQKTADYMVQVTAGDVYHMGKLEVKELSPELTALFLTNWKMEAGAPYDTSYPALFLKKNAKELHVLDGYSASYKQYEHEDTHVVDLVVTFRRGGPLS
jgi:outer membrane protein insertion porin family